MSLGRIGRDSARAHQMPPPVIAYAAVVTQDASSPTDLLTVALQNTEDQGQLSSELAPWPAKDSLPQRGDECLVVIDDTGRPWVVAWNAPGWGA